MQTRHWSLSTLVVGVGIALGAMLVSGSADAQNAKKAAPGGSTASLITGSSFDAIISALENNGFSVDMSTDSDGDSLIESTRTTTSRSPSTSTAVPTA